MKVYTKFKIGKTKWTITDISEDDSNLDYFIKPIYRVYKNGEKFDLCNGNDFETPTEAEINIMLEYKVE